MILISGLYRWHYVIGRLLFGSLYSKWTVFLEFNLIKLSLETNFHSFIYRSIYSRLHHDYTAPSSVVNMAEIV